MSDFSFERFDRRSSRFVKTPQLTLQASGSMSMNAAAHQMMGEPKAVELLYDKEQRVIGLRGVEENAPHAYPVRGIGKNNTGTFVLNSKAFCAYYDIPLGVPVRREVRMAGDVLIVDLKDEGQIATSNRNAAKSKASAAQTSQNGHGDAEQIAAAQEGLPMSSGPGDAGSG
jgi:hypothetical protein